MSNPNNHEDFNPLNKLISLLVLMGSALYFTGWIYRWEYFSLFNIQLTSLALPLESFYFAAFQVFFGDFCSVSKTIFGFFALLIIPPVFSHLFLLIKNNKNKFPLFLLIKNNKNKFPFNLVFKKQNYTCKFIQIFFAQFIFVLLCLFILFDLAKFQGYSDALKDMANKTSTLPEITLVLPEKNSALGRRLDKTTLDPFGFRIIGDSEIYKNFFGQELNEANLIWRLLIDRDNYFCVFQALPDRSNQSRVPVVIIYKSTNGDQLAILTPSIIRK